MINRIFILKTFIIFLIIGNGKNSFGQENLFSIPHSNRIVTSPDSNLEFGQKIETNLFYLKNTGIASNQYKYYIDFSIKIIESKTNFMAIKASSYKNVLGVTEFGIAKYTISSSDKLKLNKNSSITFGIGGTWNQISVNRNNLQWGNQYDGDDFESTISSNENLDFLNRSHLDFSAGMTYSWTKNSPVKASKRMNYKRIKRGVQFGVSANNIGDISKTEDSPNTPVRLNIFAKAEGITTNGKIYWSPQIYSVIQNGKMKVNIGSFAHYKFNDNKNSDVALGFFYTTKNKISPSMKIEQQKWSFSISYDVLMGQYRMVRGTKGGVGLFMKYSI